MNMETVIFLALGGIAGYYIGAHFLKTGQAA